MGLIPSFTGSVIYTVLQFIVFLFVFIATPISQLDSISSAGCYTLFGYKADCSSSHYNARGTSAFGCVARRDSMNSGAAFAIISIFVTLGALIFGLLMLLRIPCAVCIPMILTAISTITITISWACVAGVHERVICGWRWGYTTHYGPGFGLMVTAFCLEFINLILLLVMTFL